MFGEYLGVLPGTGVHVDWWVGFMAEAFGTFLLMTLILALTEGCNVGRPHEHLAPLFIGATVAAIICILAPLTQAGLNPARDFGPRVFAYLAGWGRIAIPGPDEGYLGVYIVAPVLGAVIAALFFTLIIQPHLEKDTACDAKCC